ncbi:MAG: hypothetical protein ABSH25_08110 [Syntrophorhabdales bacterium]|jgi:molybdopterin converting factor small subunit
MVINVEYVTNAREVTRKAGEQVNLKERTTVGELLDRLTSRYGLPFKKAIEHEGAFMFISRKDSGYRSVPAREMELEDGDFILFGGVIVGG